MAQTPMWDHKTCWINTRVCKIQLVNVIQKKKKRFISGIHFDGPRADHLHNNGRIMAAGPVPL